MKFDKFEIEFDSVPERPYFAGEILSGRVILHTCKIETIRSLKIKINGSANVEWSEKSNDGYRTYSTSEQYFVQYLSLLESEDSSQLPVGANVFTFSTRLPNDLPSSFEGQYGHVRYYARAIISVPSKLDLTSQKVFSVNANVDLNTIEDAKAKIEKEKSKYICCLCCTSGPIFAHCWLEQTGYVPGEDILFSAEILNQSNIGSMKSFVRLVQSIVYHANGKQRKIDTVLSEGKRPAFRLQDYWNNFKLAVPPLPPSSSSLRVCKIIDIEYFIEFTVDPGVFSVGLNLNLPIKIGTIPLSCNFSRFQNNSNGMQLPLSYVEKYENLPTLSSHEYYFPASHITAEEDGTKDMNVVGFKPIYIFYTQQEALQETNRLD